MTGERDDAPGAEVVLVRHAETDWSLAGRHTGRTDIPLTEGGRSAAAGLAAVLEADRFARVLVSPSRRAQETCELAGLGDMSEVRHDLLEWDYGAYEGLTTLQIRAERSDWDLWRDGCPGGESAADVGARADRVIGELRRLGGVAAVFSHGHLLRVLGARWADLPPQAGARLGLSPGGVCLLGHERSTPIIARWNEAAGA